MSLQEKPHRRYNQLSGDWVLVSPHRTKRPWQGAQENAGGEQKPSYDPNCYLCPGNTRAGGKQTPKYEDTFVFINDFSALLPDIEGEEYAKGLLHAKSERGICKVICFSPRHDLTLNRMESVKIERVVQTWQQEYQSLSDEPFINYVQIFENRGQAMGCSNPHPHGQIWSNESIPQIPMKESLMQQSHRDRHHSCLLCDYLKQELDLKERLVAENSSFLALVPWWAVWPYEVLLLPKAHRRSLTELNDTERRDLASIMKEIGNRYDNLFRCNFPYSMGVHQAPTDGKLYPEWHLHFHYYPPLLRSASVKKFMVGYEMMANPQRDITAERSAQELRNLSPLHYLEEKA